MTSIFGLVDPDGVDAERVLSAVAKGPSRGEPRSIATGAAVVGICDAGNNWVRLEAGPDSIFAFDGTIDALLRPSESEKSDPVVAIRDQLFAGNIDALEDVAGDFAFAYYRPSVATLLLGRDALGMRPLFYAVKGKAVGFSTDQEVLVALGLASGEPDADVIRRWLARSPLTGRMTGLVGVSRVPGGYALRFDSGQETTRRWFRPERIREIRLSSEEAAEETERLVVAAVRDRIANRSASLWLSGGRDSCAVAAAAARAGLKLHVLTLDFPGHPSCSEIAEARLAADELGFEWSVVPVTSSPQRSELIEYPAIAQTPIDFPAYVQINRMAEALGSLRCEVTLDGEGGEPLFDAGPAGISDLILRGRVISAIRAARDMHLNWRFNWKTTVRSLAFTHLPDAARNRFIRQFTPHLPPWIPDESVPPPVPPPPGRDLPRGLRAYGLSVMTELFDRHFLRSGARLRSPLLDVRVVRFALSLPPHLRLPKPDPKPVLGKLLGSLERTRRKASFTPYYASLGASTARLFPQWLERGSVWRELVEVPSGYRYAEDPKWSASLLQVLVLEAWLRQREGFS